MSTQRRAPLASLRCMEYTIEASATYLPTIEKVVEKMRLQSNGCWQTEVMREMGVGLILFRRGWQWWLTVSLLVAHIRPTRVNNFLDLVPIKLLPFAAGAAGVS